MKKILIFSMTYLPFVGGAEIATKEITDRIDSFDFDLITARLDKKLEREERIGNVNVYRVGQGWALDKYLFPFLAYFKAKKLHKEKEYQITQAIMAFYSGLAALFFKLKYPKVKYLLTMQSGDSDFFIWIRTWFWYPIYRMIYTKPDYIQAISKFLVKRAKNHGYKGEIEVIPNGVNLEEFKVKDEITERMPTVIPTSILKKELNINQRERVILTVSRLVKKNGVDDLIKAGQYLDFPFKILIIGIGPDEEKLKKLVKKLKLQDKIVFQGHIDYKELPSYYVSADVFVRSSLTEGLGNVFLEAMTAGLPVIGTNVGGIPDFLEDRKTGLFCEIRNPKDIAEKIEEILENDNLRKTLSKNGYDLVQEKYSWDKISQQMKKIYLKLINE